MWQNSVDKLKCCTESAQLR